MPSGNLAVNSITTLAGPPFISIILNWGLFGALSIQVYMYCQVFPNDPRRLTFLVYAIYLLETAQTFLLTAAVWQSLVSGFGMLEPLDSLGPEGWISVCVIGGIVAFLVQVFYAYRIKKFSKNIYISCFIIFMATCSLAGALGTGVNAAQSQAFSQVVNNRSRAYTVVALWLGGGSSCDVVIALSMCYYSRKIIQCIYFKSTQRLISRLARMSLETGTLTASVSIVCLCLFYIPGLRFYWQVPMSVTAKLYSTTLLAILNNRINLSPASDHIIPWDSEDSIPVSKPSARHTEHIQIQFVSDMDGSMEDDAGSSHVVYNAETA